MDIKDYILNNVDKHPGDVVNLTMQRFLVTRPAVHKHLNILIREGKIFAQGKTRQRRYYLCSTEKIRLSLALQSVHSESDIWDEQIQSRTRRLNQNIQRICEYGFSEMVNNVIDHSKASKLDIKCDFSGKKLEMFIHDDGVGIFDKVKNALSLSSHREAILHLSKGKFTTDPENHTGEGIFFTSRIFDRFSINANRLQYTRFEEDDWLVDTSLEDEGTTIEMTLDRNAKKTLIELFNKYSDPAEDYSFSKTKVMVELGLNPDETYISRSQAKRILLNLERFKYVMLDFKKVDTIGQSFVDEVFRVFKQRHPDIQLSYVNANDNVDFMIKRGLA